MKKTAQLIKEHFSGKKTKQSEKVMKIVSAKLVEAGFKSPFKIRIAKQITANVFKYDDMDKEIYDENDNAVYSLEKNDKETRHINVNKIDRNTLDALKSVLVQKGIMSPEDTLDYYWGEIPSEEPETDVNQYFNPDRLKGIETEEFEEESDDDFEEIPEEENFAPEEVESPAYKWDELEGKVYGPDYEPVFDLEKDVDELDFDPNDLVSFKNFLVARGIMQQDDVLESEY